MNCINCGKPVEIDPIATLNAKTYINPVIIKSKCCGIGYTITPIIHLEITPYLGDKLIDDWGDILEPFDDNFTF